MQGARQMSQSKIRMPDDLKSWLTKKAIEDGRSFNSLVFSILKKFKEDESKIK